MKKKNRLLTNKYFKNVLDKKNSVSCGEFVIYAKKNDLNYVRVGISVSSKIGNSVVRHKIKRQISMMFRNKFLFNNFHDNEENLKKMLFKLCKREEK